MASRFSQIVVLGAGASYGARPDLPENQRPPTGDHLARYLTEWLEVNRAVLDPLFVLARENRLDGTAPSPDVVRPGPFMDGFAAFLKRAASTGFEAEAGKLVRQFGTPEGEWIDFRRLNRTIAFSMLTGRGCRFGVANPGDLYDQLLRRLDVLRRRDVMIVTFNYDILLEEAAARVAGSVEPLDVLWYPGVRLLNGNPARDLHVYKPHGSVNWFAVPNHIGRSATSSAIRTRPASASMFGDKILGFATDEEYVPPRGRPNAQLELKHSPSVSPILALYTDGKPVSQNMPSIALHRGACLSAIRASPTAAVTIIGLRPPKDSQNDPFLSELFDQLAHCDARRLYVSPDENDCSAAKRWGFDTRVATFEDFLAEL